MPSSKTRINLTVPQDVERQLHRLAKRDDQSVARMALDLIRRALDTEEDGELLSVAQEREHSSGRFVSHARAWK